MKNDPLEQEPKMEEVHYIEEARSRLGPDAEILDALIGAEPRGLDWYLKEKIVKPSDQDEFRDHVRVLKYALCFVLGGATVTFLQEKAASKTPDLRVTAHGFTFYLEVRKLRMTEDGNKSPAQKIVSAVFGKLKQLPPGQINLVAVDNFDIHLESTSHGHIEEAIEILGRRSVERPADYGPLSGVILEASTPGGIVSANEETSSPHFFWVNPYGANVLPPALAQWTEGALPQPLATAGGAAWAIWLLVATRVAHEPGAFQRGRKPPLQARKSLFFGAMKTYPRKRATPLRHDMLCHGSGGGSPSPVGCLMSYSCPLTLEWGSSGGRTFPDSFHEAITHLDSGASRR